MARLRRFDLEELAARPGTYFNPETEILIVVDDSAHPGAQLADDIDDGDWILVGDEVPLDDAERDELLERLEDRKSTRLNSSHGYISYAVFCLKKKKKKK